MRIKELSKWTDDQVFAKTGEHLDTLQKDILEGVLEHPNFCKVAKNNGYSYDHVKKEGAELWKILSEVFEENIKQCNVKSILENKFADNIYNFSSQQTVIGDNGTINICRENQQDRGNKKRRSPSSNSQNQFPIIDLKNAPELNYNYGRKTEIDQLKDWLENKTKLITIYGLSKIGKTALILKLIPEIQENFDYIFYRTLDNKPTLINLKDELKQFFAQSQEKPLPKVIDYFRSYRCLVILDDVHNIFKTGDLAGQYLPEFKDYSRFLQKVASLDHQSCIILISWEKPQQIDQLEAENFNVKTLQLSGLGEDGKEILTEKGLKDEDQYLQFINLYQGNPSWLNLIANIIKDDFNREISQFLALDELCLEGIEIMLENHLERLSDTERNLINNLADQDQAIDIKQQSIKIRKSLIRRCLLEQILQENEIKYQLNPIFKAYLNS